MSVQHVHGEGVDGLLEHAGCLWGLSDEVDIVQVDDAIPAIHQRQIQLIRVAFNAFSCRLVPDKTNKKTTKKLISKTKITQFIIVRSVIKYNTNHI